MSTFVETVSNYLKSAEKNYIEREKPLINYFVNFEKSEKNREVVQLTILYSYFSFMLNSMYRDRCRQKPESELLVPLKEFHTTNKNDENSIWDFEKCLTSSSQRFNNDSSWSPKAAEGFGLLLELSYNACVMIPRYAKEVTSDVNSTGDKARSREIFNKQLKALYSTLIGFYPAIHLKYKKDEIIVWKKYFNSRKNVKHAKILINILEFLQKTKTDNISSPLITEKHLKAIRKKCELLYA